MEVIEMKEICWIRMEIQTEREGRKEDEEEQQDKQDEEE